MGSRAAGWTDPRNTHKVALTSRCGEAESMISPAAGPSLDRRTLLRGAILLVGGTLANGVAMPLLAAPGTARFFTPDELRIVAEFADIIIPRTDTPGAKDAGVPEALDGLMANWASEARKADFRALVAR